MYKFLKKSCLVLLILSLMASTFLTGCGNEEEKVDSAAIQTTTQTTAQTTVGEVKKLEEINLKFYNVGGQTPGWETVLGEINKKLTEKINATVSVDFLSWSDFEQKYPLLFASGEQFDLIYTSNWCFFTEEGTKGAFMPLDELLPQYAPKIWSEAPEEVWEYAKIKGKISMIPAYLANVAAFGGFMYREDLRKKYGVPEIKKLSDFEAFFDAIKANEPTMTPIALGSADYWSLYSRYRTEIGYTEEQVSSTQMVYKFDEAAPKVTIEVFEPHFLEWAKIAKTWADKGFWSKNVLANQTTAKDSFNVGTTAAAGWNSWHFNDAYVKAKEEHPDWEVAFYYPEPPTGKTFKASYAGSGVAVNAVSKNPERALMAVELMMYDQEIYNLSSYGIEGVDYTVNADGSFVTPEGKKAEEVYGQDCLWGLGIHNDAWRKPDLSLNSPDFNDKLYNMDFYNSVTTFCPIGTMTLDNEPFANELAACTDLYNTYFPILACGLSNDPEATLKEYQDKLKTAGVEKMQKEIQAQIDASLAGK